MGSSYSQEDYDRVALELYETALQNPCLFSDIGIDESLLKFSGTDSFAVLQAYSDDFVTSIPGYLDRLGSALAPLTSVPNAVGIGALMISMIMEICLKSLIQTHDDSYSLLRWVFGELKASAVRDTMSEYLKCHETFLSDDQLLLEEILRLEAQLSNDLTIVRNSLLYDGQMSSRGFKIWVNGAFFYLQMLLHKARLNIETGKRAAVNENAIKATIGLYLQDLHKLLEKYKTFKKRSALVIVWTQCYWIGCSQERCGLHNDEANCIITPDPKYLGQPYAGLGDSYVDLIFSKYEPIAGLKSQFSNVNDNLTSLINQTS